MKKILNFLLNILFLKLLVFQNIKSSSNSHFSVKFKYLIKDAMFENLIKKDGSKVTCIENKITENVSSFHLSQSFLETEINPKKPFKHPFLLIPLYRIKYENENIQHSFFEENINNKIEKLDNDYYFYPKAFQPVNFSSLFYKTKDGEKVNLSDGLDVQKNGYLIFKDHNSEDSILYFAIFINKLNLSPKQIEFQNLYNNLLIQGESIKDKTFSMNFSLELNINILRLKEGLVTLLPFNNETEKNAFFLLKLINETNFNFLSVVLKPQIVGDELSFDVIKYNSDEVCNNFMKLSHSNKKSEIYIKNCLKGEKIQKDIKCVIS